MGVASKIVSEITTAEQATAAVDTLQQIEHALTSKKEASALLKAKSEELGFTWDKKTKSYKASAAVDDQSAVESEEAALDPNEKKGRKRNG